MDHILPSTDGEHIYVAGKVGGGSYNPYEVAYIAKFKTDGTFLWVKKTSSSGSESWGVAEASNGDLITGFGVGGAQVIDFGDGAELEPNSIGWFGALVRFDKDGTVKVLKYVADALYTDPSSVGAQALRLYHLSIDRSDQVILTGELTGTHQFKNNLEATSTPGLGGSASKNAGIIICDLNFNPLAVYTNTGGNNEWGRKSVSKGDKIYYSGEYESVTHAFFGTFRRNLATSFLHQLEIRISMWRPYRFLSLLLPQRFASVSLNKRMPSFFLGHLLSVTPFRSLHLTWKRMLGMLSMRLRVSLRTTGNSLCQNPRIRASTVFGIRSKWS